MNGFEMARAFRDWCATTQPPGFHLPVVALSADVMDEQVMKCKEAGFDGAFCGRTRAKTVFCKRRARS